MPRANLLAAKSNPLSRRSVRFPKSTDEKRILCFQQTLLFYSTHSCTSSQSCNMTTPDALDALRSTRLRVAKPVIRPRVSSGRIEAPFTRIPLKLPLRQSTENDNECQAGVRASDEPVQRPTQNIAYESHVQREDSASRDWINYLGQKHPLRVIFVGHNPSDHSWDVCAPYAHHSNKFWKLVGESELVPETLSIPSSFTKLPVVLGLGFIDLFVTRGSDARVVERSAGKETGWRELFIQRLLAGTGGCPPKILACVSKTVAQQLLPKWKGDFGPVGFGSEWNLPGLEQVHIWVLPSTSARAVLPHEKRLAPFVALKQRLDLEPSWDPSNHMA